MIRIRKKKVSSFMKTETGRKKEESPIVIIWVSVKDLAVPKSVSFNNKVLQ
jgi:hypothetical protein